MRKDIQKLRKKMKHTLDKERYQHTLGVMYLASSLAMCHKEDVDKALTAGVLHDCAKCIPAGERIARCEAYGLPVTDVERKNPSLLHAKLGAKMAQEIYGVQDPDILNAIASHTTGRPGMSLLEKIIYVADYIEPGREELPNIAAIRYLAFHDLDGCLYCMLQDNLDYLNSRNIPVDPMTERTYQYYKNARE